MKVKKPKQLPARTSGMFDLYTLDENGEPQPCDVTSWAKWMEDHGAWEAMTAIGDVTVATIFLGLDASYGLSGQPLLWQTMILERTNSVYCKCYPSSESAKEGHAAACRRVFG